MESLSLFLLPPSPLVARNILAMGEQHEVQLDELSHVTVKAEPMDLPLPSAVEVSSLVFRHRQDAECLGGLASSQAGL